MNQQDKPDPIFDDLGESPVLSKLDALIRKHRPAGVDAPVLTDRVNKNSARFSAGFPTLIDPVTTEAPRPAITPDPVVTFEVAALEEPPLLLEIDDSNEATNSPSVIDSKPLARSNVPSSAAALQANPLLSSSSIPKPRPRDLTALETNTPVVEAHKTSSKQTKTLYWEEEMLPPIPDHETAEAPTLEVAELSPPLLDDEIPVLDEIVIDDAAHDEIVLDEVIEEPLLILEADSLPAPFEEIIPDVDDAVAQVETPVERIEALALDEHAEDSTTLAIEDLPASEQVSETIEPLQSAFAPSVEPEVVETLDTAEELSVAPIEQSRLDAPPEETFEVEIAVTQEVASEDETENALEQPIFDLMGEILSAPTNSADPIAAILATPVEEVSHDEVPVLTELALEYDEELLPLLDPQSRSDWVADMVEEVIQEITPKIRALVRAQLGLQIGGLMKTVTEEVSKQLQDSWRNELKRKIEKRVVDEVDANLKQHIIGQVIQPPTSN